MISDPSTLFVDHSGKKQHFEMPKPRHNRYIERIAATIFNTQNEPKDKCYGLLTSKQVDCLENVVIATATAGAVAAVAMGVLIYQSILDFYNHY